MREPEVGASGRALEVVDERSIIPELLEPGGWVLDVGARGYVFAREMARRGMKVIALDPQAPGPEFFEEASTKNIHAVEAGLVGIGRAGEAVFATWDDGEAACFTGHGGPVPDRAKTRMAKTFDVRQIMEKFNVSHFSVVKMNCEGAEYSILETWPGPIADQIAVSFHDHTGANLAGEETYRRILDGHLYKWYDAERHVREDRYCAGWSYWDSLFVRRGL